MESSCFRIVCRPSPFRPAVKTRKDDCVLVSRSGNKLALVAKTPELVQRPLVCLGRAVGQHLFRQALARIGCRLGGKRLLRSRNFSFEVAPRMLSGFHRVQRNSIRAIKQKSDCATAPIIVPSCLTVTGTGGAEKSRSQIS